MIKKVFICSPYRGNIEENKKKAVTYARITVMSGDIPIVPHLYFPAFLDEKIPNDFNPVNIKTIPVDERADARYRSTIRNLRVLK